ncbi:MAG: hypothetical protein CME16_07075 [Gemmatimonadetes bacterium]|nr:hypothetical protein [Gemmatimonadota bacterium]
MNFFFVILERLRQRQLSISAKVSLLFAFIVLGLSSVLYFFFLDYESGRNSEAFDRRAQLLLNQMVANSSYPMLVGDREAVARIGRSAMGLQGMESCSILDSVGDTIFFQGEKAQGYFEVLREDAGTIFLEEEGGDRRAYQRKISALVWAEGDPELLVMDTFVGQEQVVGMVKITFSLKQEKEDFNAVQTKSIQVIIGAALGGILLLHLLLNSLLNKPVRQLEQGAETISQGDLAYRVPIFSRDEIGRLGDSFNRMAERLEGLIGRFKETNDELASSNQMLKDRSEHISQLNGLLNAIRSISRLIVSEKDRQRLISQSCRYLLESHGFTHAWINLFKIDGREGIFAESGVGENFAVPLAAGLAQGKGYPCVAVALDQRGAVVPIKEPENCDCPLSNCIPQHRGCASGRAAGSVALVHGSEVFGVLSVAVAAKETLEDKTELGLLQEVAGDIAFALHDIDAALHRERAETELEVARKSHTQTLEGMLQQKEMLLREVHHRVKNNLQVMMSLIRMQVRRSSDSTRLPLEDTLGRLRAMTHALDWLHMETETGEHDLGQYLGRLGTDLRAFFPEGVKLEMDRVRVGARAEQVVPIGLIVNELVTNALQHAFPEDADAGTVKVGVFQGDGGELIIEVVDDGVGISDEVGQGSGGIGMTLVQSLAEQMGGRLESERLDRGTRMRVVCSRRSNPT